MCSLVISILTLFIVSSGRTTFIPGSLPTEYLPTKSIPSTSHNTEPRQSAENIQNKKAENPVIVPCFASTTLLPKSFHYVQVFYLPSLT